ncbi:hypothetical protein K432DRAFT_392295 [Lepidopterella palustris CBS 459.81]|uniref:Uncharacterized protein n=1 Tax=Lepidopterella palustris CBS 459.81 TaxID=1314670 RepID=A0A8E2JG39_9PEZI|nr:hypothetical protein K432DRAFT_392295 [Lepidopterella palustris CBS 459.81]
MPPSSSRRLRSRREADLQQQSDADTPESIATPSRKRRRLNGADRTSTLTEDAARVRITESAQSDDSNKTIENGTDAEALMDPIERQTLVITHLLVPKTYTPHASIDYANDLQMRRNPGTTPAFAKIAAREWCFFVKKMKILIGRADNNRAPPIATVGSSQSESTPSDVTEGPAEWGVDIDLGPERQVSRVHAEIRFDIQQQAWVIQVNSRNGLKLDDRVIDRGMTEVLHSGICISIMGTQMVFLLADGPDRFHPMLYRQVRYDQEHEDSDGTGHHPHRSLPHAHPRASSPSRQLFDPFPPSSHPRNQNSSHFRSSQMTTTPGRGQPGTPLALRTSEKEPRSKPSPSAYPRGMMLDSTEEIDYSLDSSKDIKPPHSYAQLIGQAILSSPEEMLTLANIYNFIKEKYAFFRHSTGGWQNSIRHNLSLSKSFDKVARRTDEPGKGMKWRISDEHRDEFIKKTIYSTRKGQARMDSSGPNSPAFKDTGSTQATERLMGVISQGEGVNLLPKLETGGARVKTPPRSATPPLASYPLANESYTPDRGPRPQNSRSGYIPPSSIGEQTHTTPVANRLLQGGPQSTVPVFAHSSDSRAPIDPSTRTVDHAQSLPTTANASNNPGGLTDAAAHSPPPLYSDTASNAVNGAPDIGRASNAGLVTPLVTRHAPRLAPPSTAQVPSQYINFSSPAPFWKFVDLPSTPARVPNLDLSPTKMMRGGDGNAEAEDEPAQPSSPPLMFESGDKNDEDMEDQEDEEGAEAEEDMEINSPSRTVSRPVSRREVPAFGAREKSMEQPTAALNGLGIANGGIVRGSLAALDEDEPEGIDITK